MECKRREKSTEMSLAFSARFQSLCCTAVRACRLNCVHRGVVVRNSPLVYAETVTVVVSMRQDAHWSRANETPIDSRALSSFDLDQLLPIWRTKRATLSKTFSFRENDNVLQ